MDKITDILFALALTVFFVCLYQLFILLGNKVISILSGKRGNK